MKHRIQQQRAGKAASILRRPKSGRLAVFAAVAGLTAAAAWGVQPVANDPPAASSAAPSTQPAPAAAADVNQQLHAAIDATTRPITSTPTPNDESAAVPTATQPLADVTGNAPSTEIAAGDAQPAPYRPGPSDFLLDPAVGDRLLMQLLGPDSPLAQAGVQVGGHIQGGYTFNPQRSADDTIFGRVFDDGYGNSPQIDQIALSASRRVARDRWDLGGKVELIYGYDTFRLHANGLDFYGGCDEDLVSPERAPHDPRNQFDLTQAYLDLNVPVGNGLLVRAGKFVTPIGYETIDPTTTPFYSRSYLFGFAKPFTHTGILLNYPLDESWSVWGGAVRGWDQALKDNNDSWSLLGRVDWRATERLFLSLSGIFGREADGDGCCCCGEDSSRLLVDLIASYAVSDRLGLGLEVLYGRSGGADSTGGAAEWFGFAGYASYLISPAVTANARLEWFRDADGVRLLTGSNLELTSITLGLAVRPFGGHRYLSPLTVQPEIRYDHATAPEFDGGTRHNQLTLGVGVLFAF